jgi:ribonuclease R
MNQHAQDHRSILRSIAHRAMLERGLLPDFSREALAELEQIQHSAVFDSNTIRDNRDLLWASIDNDDSRDLDQVTVAEDLSDGKVKILVAIADVDASIKKGSAIDDHAHTNTTSVYTAAEIFPMLPEKISTDVTSLNLDQDRLAIVVEMVIRADGSLQESTIYKAQVRNHAKLAYNSVAAWLDKKSDIPIEIPAVQGLAENLQLQDRAAQNIKNLRHLSGALSLETIESSQYLTAIKSVPSK